MINNPTEEVSWRIERMARELVKSGGADPEQLLQPGRPQCYGTSQGEAFAVVPEAALPMWRFYIKAARIALDIADSINSEPEMPTVTILGAA